MPEPESPNSSSRNSSSQKSESAKVVRAITPGMRNATSVTDPSSRSAKRIVVNTTSARISQRVAIQKESGQIPSGMSASSSVPVATTAVGTPNKNEGTGFGKILTITLVILAVIIGGALFAVSKKSSPPLTEPQPSSIAPSKAPVPTPAAAASSSSSSPLQRGLLAHWKLDDNLDEATGTQGTARTTNPPKYIDGRVGKAIRLDGADPVVVELLSLELKQLQDTFSIALWVRLPSNVTQKNWAGFVTRGEELFRTSIHAVDSGEFHIGLARYNAGSAAKPTILSTKDKKYPTDTWHHVCAVRDNNSLYLYVDGELDALNKSVATMLDRTSNIPLVIGGNASFKPENNRNLVGDIDEVRIYDRALDFDEVQQLATMP